MNKTLSVIFIVLSLAGGIIGGMTIQKRFLKDKPNDLAVFKEIVRVRELHLMNYTYQDIFFLHKNNDQNKQIKAISIVPVEVSAYINLKEIQLNYHNDTLVEIRLPEPVIKEPNYMFDNMTIKNVSSFQIYIGKNLYVEVAKHISEIMARRKYKIEQIATAQGIIENTKTEATLYIESILKGLNLFCVPIRFIEKHNEAAEASVLPKINTKIEEQYDNMIGIESFFENGIIIEGKNN